HLRTIDIIDFVSIFNADDSFRFFLAKQAFSNIDLYSWNYYLPIALILDGTLVSLFGDDISLSRTLKLIIALSANIPIYLALRRSFVSPGFARASMLVAIMMPVYIYVLISFLGESWLAIFIGGALFF